ncbi:hypothetical protein BX600DRAFT_433532 [Xylariales sp. PMI_506]|nr:hypothetical protein BX600DRAFT_433532 [Xylariales sp. PMI_506]
MPGLYQTTGLAALLLLLFWGFRSTYSDAPSSYRVGEPIVGHVASDPPSIPIAEPHTVESAPPEIPVESYPSPSQVGTDKPVNDETWQHISDRPLITYAYAESDSARENIKFFINQGLHGAADFIFIINGETNITKTIPSGPNIRIIERPNKCFDLGAHGEVLRQDDLWKKYRKFITLNASIRGPFMPYWSQRCWSDVFLSRVTDEVKLVGMTANCLPKYHIQSMIWATDLTGLELLLYPPPGSSSPDKYGTKNDMVAMEGCYTEMHKAIHGEIGATAVIKNAGYKVDALMAAFHKSEDYERDCAKNPIEDILWDKQYYGANIHPYETLFMKANRDIDPTMVKLLTEWHLQGTMEGSWNVCGR